MMAGKVAFVDAEVHDLDTGSRSRARSVKGDTFVAANVHGERRVLTNATSSQAVQMISARIIVTHPATLHTRESALGLSTVDLDRCACVNVTLLGVPYV